MGPVNFATMLVVVFGASALALRPAPDAVRVVAPTGHDTESRESGAEPELTKLIVTVLALAENVASLTLICEFCEYVPNRLPAKPAIAAAITTATATRITVAITGEIAFLDLFVFFRYLVVDIIGADSFSVSISSITMQAGWNGNIRRLMLPDGIPSRGCLAIGAFFPDLGKEMTRYGGFAGCPPRNAEFAVNI